MSPKQKRDLVLAYFDAWARGDRAALLSLFAADAVVVDPVGAPPHVGVEAIGRFFDHARGLPGTYEPVVHRVVLAGDGALVSFTMRTYGADGAGLQVDVSDVMTFGADGRIVRLEAWWDQRCMSAYQR
jgi:steroid delta-isomerase